MVGHGEIWLLQPPNGKTRPVLVVTRNEAIPVLNNVVVAPITSTIRRIPTAIPVGSESGVDHESVATFDALASVPKALLSVRLGVLEANRRGEICSALAALSNC